MNAVIRHTPTIFPTVRDARLMAAKLNDEEGEIEGWTYKVQPNDNGTARIAIYDHKGDFVDHL